MGLLLGNGANIQMIIDLAGLAILDLDRIHQIDDTALRQNIEKDAFVYDSDVLDITEPLRESLLLAEPMQALCKEDCQGLCTVCGADLNDGDCGCDKVSVDPRLAALKQFIKN